jgi:hypothetical protein
MVEYLSSRYKTLCSTPSTAKQQQQNANLSGWTVVPFTEMNKFKEGAGLQTKV